MKQLLESRLSHHTAKLEFYMACLDGKYPSIDYPDLLDRIKSEHIAVDNFSGSLTLLAKHSA